MSLQEIVKKEYVENDNTLCFKSTPVEKVLVLSFVTGGVYDIILAFNFWKSLRDNFGYKVSPFWRGLFVPITNFRLFSIFAKYFDNFNIKFSYAGGLAGLYIFCSWLSNKISFKTLMLDNTNWLLEGVYTILCIVTALIFAFLQNKINKINEQYYPNAPKNPWKPSNIIWTIIFLILWGFSYLPS